MIEKVAEQFYDISLDDIKVHPELITDVLFDEHDLSLLLEKRGNSVRFAYLRRYDHETTRILEEAKHGYAQKQQEGYTREQAFKDLVEAQEAIRAQSKSR